METTSGTSAAITTSDEQSFLSKYGLWVGLGLLLVLGFVFSGQIKTMLGVGSASAGGAALPPQPGTASDTTNPNTPAKPAVVGNDYVSGEVINKVLLGNYLHHTDLIPNGTSYAKATPAQQAAYNSFNGRIAEVFGTNKDSTGLDWTGVYVTAFFKGMDLAERADYVGIFKDYIQQYLDSPAKMPHWDVKLGEFRKSGVNQ